MSYKNIPLELYVDRISAKYSVQLVKVTTWIIIQLLTSQPLLLVLSPSEHPRVKYERGGLFVEDGMEVVESSLVESIGGSWSRSVK